jgi:hypothetical protein
MTPIYDRNGRTIAWMNNNYIYHLSGRQVLAFVNNNSVFTYGSRHIGRLSNGFFRDRFGHAIAFIQGATNGPMPPIPQIPPIPPIPAIPPIPPLPPIPPIPPINSLSWSNFTWENFINV